MHSGGSISGSEALLGLSKSERLAAGEKGGVIRCFYIGVLLPKKGMSIFETFQNVVASPDLDKGFVVERDQSFHVIAEVGGIFVKELLVVVGWEKGADDVRMERRR